MTVPIVDDSVAESYEVFYGRLSNVGGSSVQIDQDTAEVIICDDDGE